MGNIPSRSPYQASSSHSASINHGRFGPDPGQASEKHPPGGGALEFSVTGLCPSKNFSSPNEGIFRVNRHPIGEFFIGNDTQ